MAKSFGGSTSPNPTLENFELPEAALGDFIEITAANGDVFCGYYAAPQSVDVHKTAPVIVVLQEIFGVNQNMRNICDDLALSGMHAIAPDLFWRQKPRIDLTDQTEAEWTEAFGYFQKFDWDKGLADVQTTIDYARGLPSAGAKAKVGVIGYCMGGKMAYLIATRGDCDASVAYYGTGIEDVLHESSNLKTPVMLHNAGKDEYVKPEAKTKVPEHFKDNPLVTVHNYPDREHAFARVWGKHYDENDSMLANDRTFKFLKQHLS